MCLQHRIGDMLEQLEEWPGVKSIRLNATRTKDDCGSGTARKLSICSDEMAKSFMTMFVDTLSRTGQDFLL